jgi:protease IV
LKAIFRRIGVFLTGLRVWTVNLLTLAFAIYFIVIIGSIVKQLPDDVDPEGKVLILAPQATILDQETFVADFNFPFLGMPADKQLQTRDLVRLIRAAAEDDRLAGVLIDFSKARFAGTSTAMLLAEELAALREAGKPVIAYSETLTTGSYLMAAQADEIFVHNAGAVAISGLGGYRQYTRELTDKLKINWHNYSQGDFKSAVEGRTRNDMSEADKMQRRELYGPIWDALKQRMAQGRGISPKVLQAFADEHSLPLLQEAGFDGLAYAAEQGIIDGTKSHPEFRAYMIDRFGKADDEDRDTYPHIRSSDYLAQLEAEKKDTEDAVAVVFVQGAIQPGPQGPGMAGSDDIARLLRKAHEDDSTRAIVMRVNSPGGSIIASDIIAEEFRAARSKEIPVYVSMGDVAASGGVWVSMPADRIYAEPNTITGSIGVAVAFPTFENLLAYIGVNYDGVATSERAGWNVHSDVNQDLDAYFARWAGTAYQKFIDNVAKSRGKEPEYIRSIAGGRVWLASQALELGLVDELGTMEDAVKAAADAAGIDDYRINYVVKKMPPHIALLQQFGASVGGQQYREFSLRMEKLFDIVAGIDRPTATVMCTDCMIEIL